MSPAPTPLRSLQREHALLILTPGEFTDLLGKGKLQLPTRHHEHFAKVLRRHDSWRALAANGIGQIATCEVQKDTVVLAAEEIQVVERHSACVRLVQAWPKPKALSLILQKAAELGTAEIVLVTSERAGHAGEKPERMEAILENACMQAYNVYKPSLTIAALSDESLYAGRQAFFGDIEGTQKLRNLQLPAADEVTFVNGPEGGFSAHEAAWLRQRATGILLSENVLRSETAAIIALGHFCQVP